MEWLLCFALFLRCQRVVLSVIIIRESDNGTGKPKTGYEQSRRHTNKYSHEKI